MMNVITHKFVELIPDHLDDKVLYISIEHCVAIHKCACGCGKEVVTPISPDGWQLVFDGETVSLSPSIGNWNLKCRSHYWIRKNYIVFVGYSNEIKITKKKKSKKTSSHFWQKKLKKQESIHLHGSDCN